VNSLNALLSHRWTRLTLIFIIGPTLFYKALISPAIHRISEYEEFTHTKAGSLLSAISSSPASKGELEQLGEVKEFELTRFKKVDSRESMLHFSGAFADAIASSARSYGLKVSQVSMESPLLKGSYVPVDDNAIAKLEEFPSIQWSEASDPLDLPLLNLPNVEIQIAVTAEYSQVFSFIDSFADFPMPITLKNLELIANLAERAFRLQIRGYYCDRISASSQATMTLAFN
jgi:hypothetical protein